MAKQVSKSKQPPKAAGRGGAGKPLGKKTKKALCIGLLERPSGATIGDLAKATGWQIHSVRGFLAGTVAKLPGAKLESSVLDGKPRSYRLTKEAEPATESS